MKRIASQVSTSVENTAASAIAPSQGGSSRVSTVGSTAFGSVMSGHRHSREHPEQNGHECKAQERRRIQRDAGPNRAARSRRHTLSESGRAR